MLTVWNVITVEIFHFFLLFVFNFAQQNNFFFFISLTTNYLLPLLLITLAIHCYYYFSNSTKSCLNHLHETFNWYTVHKSVSKIFIQFEHLILREMISFCTLKIITKSSLLFFLIFFLLAPLSNKTKVRVLFHSIITLFHVY